MPGGDGTGPAGMGPMTGRAAGYCAGYGVPGYANPIPARGFWGWGRGARWGWGNRLYGAAAGGPGYPPYGGVQPVGAPYNAPFGAGMPKEQEIDFLKGQAQYLQDSLDGINKRMDELQAEGKDQAKSDQ